MSFIQILCLLSRLNFSLTAKFQKNTKFHKKTKFHTNKMILVNIKFNAIKNIRFHK